MVLVVGEFLHLSTDAFASGSFLAKQNFQLVSNLTLVIINNGKLNDTAIIGAVRMHEGNPYLFITFEDLIFGAL